MTGPSTRVVFIEDSWDLDPGERLSFGRQADLVVDSTNPYMHRVVGTITRNNAGVEVTNLGSQTTLSITSEIGTRATLASEGRLHLSETFRIYFEVARAAYEIEVHNERTDAQAAAVAVDGGTTTRSWGRIPLNYEQRLLLTAMSEEHLSGGNHVPSIKSIAAQLGWTAKKVEKKVEYMCSGYDKAGVGGLRGSIGAEAVDRRRRLVEHVVGQGIIDAADLSLLEP